MPIAYSDVGIDGFDQEHMLTGVSKAKEADRKAFWLLTMHALGNVESEAEGVGGITQDFIEPDHAVSFVKDSGYFPNHQVVIALLMIAPSNKVPAFAEKVRIAGTGPETGDRR